MLVRRLLAVDERSPRGFRGSLMGFLDVFGRQDETSQRYLKARSRRRAP